MRRSALQPNGRGRRPLVQIRAGTDIAFLGATHPYALSRNRYHAEYVSCSRTRLSSSASRYAFDETRGVFSGWTTSEGVHDTSSWNTSWTPRLRRSGPFTRASAVGNQIRSASTRVHARDGLEICGCSAADDFVKDRRVITSTFTPERTGTNPISLAGPNTAHSVQLILAAAMLQLLLGNMAAGRGPQRIARASQQPGGTDCGMEYHNLPGTSRCRRRITNR